MGSRTWTIRDVLDWATEDFARRGIDSPRLDAELLVARALGTNRVGLYLDLNRPLLASERSAIRPLVARRREREPVAYILGYRDFYGRRFSVTPDVLIPRPDTETLVEHALSAIPLDSPCRVLDAGTGSGAIAITIAIARPLATVTATDTSEDALRVAAANAAEHAVAERIQFARADLVVEGDRYDVVVSNPPYVAKPQIESLEAEVRDHEPHAALDGGEDGLDVIRALLEVSVPTTAPGADMLIEVGIEQAARVVDLANAHPSWAPVAVYKDLGRIDRVVHLRRI